MSGNDNPESPPQTDSCSRNLSGDASNCSRLVPSQNNRYKYLSCLSCKFPPVPPWRKPGRDCFDSPKVYSDQQPENARSLSRLPTTCEPSLRPSPALPRTGTPLPSTPTRHSNSSVTDGNANKHPDHLPEKPSGPPRSPDHCPPVNFQPRPNHATPFRESPNPPPTRVKPSPSTFHCKESILPSGLTCKRVRKDATYQNAEKHEPPASHLSTPGFPPRVKHPYSRLYSPVPRYNSAPCCKPPPTCSTIRSPPDCSCNQTRSKPSNKYSPAKAGNAWKSRRPTRKKDSSRKGPGKPFYYKYHSPPCRIHPLWQIIVSPTACPSAAHPENPHIRQRSPV